MLGTLFATIATTDYLPRAAVLRASVRATYGDSVRFVALLVGEEPAPSLSLDFEIVTLAELNIPTLWDMAFRYDKGAFANALKPFFLQHLMTKGDPGPLVFLDADTLVYERLDAVHRDLEGGTASIILTPHHERPQVRTREPHDLDLLRHGILNGGFVALAPDRNATAFLEWWSNHLLTGCRYEPDKGFYGDQHWLNLVPALFDKVRILRDRGYNAAYWNYPDRIPRFDGSRWWIDQSPLAFFHFSQWRLEQGETVEQSQERLFCSQGGDLARLLADYRDRCEAAAQALGEEVRRAPYPYARFADGSPIPRIVRDAYARAHEPPPERTRDELFGQGIGLVAQPAAGIPAFDGVEMPELYAHIWRIRPDLHRFSLRERAGQLGFLEWIVRHAAGDYDLPDEAVEPARRTFAHWRAVEAHASIRSGTGSFEDLLDAARTLTTAAARTLDLEPLLAAQDVVGLASLFRAIEVLGREAETRGAVPRVVELFADMAKHEAYLRREYFKDNLATSAKAMLRADAALNVCAVLLELARNAASTLTGDQNDGQRSLEARPARHGTTA